MRHHIAPDVLTRPDLGGFDTNGISLLNIADAVSDLFDVLFDRHQPCSGAQRGSGDTPHAIPHLAPETRTEDNGVLQDQFLPLNFTLETIYMD